MLIGIAVAALLAARGELAGISSVVGGLVAPAVDGRSWRALFLAGLLVGGAALLALYPAALAEPAVGSLPRLAGAGLLVGLGTRIGGGCTSGHGVCGLARRSGRSLAATITFMLVGAVTVYLARRLGALS